MRLAFVEWIGRAFNQLRVSICQSGLEPIQNRLSPPRPEFVLAEHLDRVNADNGGPKFHYDHPCVPVILRFYFDFVMFVDLLHCSS